MTTTLPNASRPFDEDRARTAELGLSPTAMTSLLPHGRESARLGAVAQSLRNPRACRRPGPADRAAPDPGLPCQPRGRRDQGREYLQRPGARYPRRTGGPPWAPLGERPPYRA